MTIGVGTTVGASRTHYQICARCIMDASDPLISFDENGVCHHCHHYDESIRECVIAGEPGRQKWQDAVARVKAEGKDKRYDCIIGLSGGVDSSYLAWIVNAAGLRPLAIHLDNGWDTEIAVRNIENIVKRLNIDLDTVVLDWEEFRSLQVAFLRASTPDSEIPTDHAINACLYWAAVRENVRFIINGSNLVTEQMVPLSWSNGHSDWKYIRTLNKLFGDRKLKSYPHFSFFHRMYYFPKIRKIEVIAPLDWLEYDKFKAIELMQRELSWVSYGGKHHESLYTRFYQGYILPRKFGADKRRPHLSCLINAGRISRDQALREIQQPAIDDDVIEQEKNFAIKKLGLSPAEFELIMQSPPKRFFDFPSYARTPPCYHLAYGKLQQKYRQTRSVWARRRAVVDRVRQAMRLLAGVVSRSVSLARCLVGTPLRTFRRVRQRPRVEP